MHGDGDVSGDALDGALGHGDVRQDAVVGGDAVLPHRCRRLGARDHGRGRRDLVRVRGRPVLRSIVPVIAIIGASTRPREIRQQGAPCLPPAGVYRGADPSHRRPRWRGNGRIPRCSTTRGRLDEATVYVPGRPGRGDGGAGEEGGRAVWLNPGADDPRWWHGRGRWASKPIVACSILAVGESPGAF